MSSRFTPHALWLLLVLILCFNGSVALRSSLLKANSLACRGKLVPIPTRSRANMLLMGVSKSSFGSALPLQNVAHDLQQALVQSALVAKASSVTPALVKTFLTRVYPVELLVLLLFKVSYSPLLKFAHQMQNALWKAANVGEASFWPNSVLAFVHERSHLLWKLMAFNYIARLSCATLLQLGFNLRSDLPDLLSRISYTLFLTHFVDRFKSQFLRVFFPNAVESRRQSYIINKSSTVVIWTIGGLVTCEMVSAFLKIPLSSTLAFGGVGGLAVGLSLRDMAANFIGGMMLLFNEPFTPGDMVTFESGKTEVRKLNTVCTTAWWLL
jgi:small-conductance mechanosensitive channel